MTLRTSTRGALRGQIPIGRCGRPAMYATHSHMICGSIFSSAYVSERHTDEARSYWVSEAKHIDFEAALNALRSALSLRK